MLKPATGALLTVLAIVGSPTAARGQGQVADAPLTIVRTFVAANETSDLDGTLGTFADDATVFLPGEPAQRTTGRTAIRDAFKQIYSRRTGAIRIVLSDVSAQLFGDTAVITAYVGPMPPVPVAQSMTLARRTFVLRHIGERWLIVHLHASSVMLAPSR